MVLPLLLGAAVVATLKQVPLVEDETTRRMGIEAIAATLFDLKHNGWYILFEIGGLLLLTAVVGAVLLSKRSLETVDDTDTTLAHRHDGHADRGTAIAHVHDAAAAASSTVVSPSVITDGDSHGSKA